MENKRFESIIEILGKPYYQGSGVALYHGDCSELLEKLPPESINLTITSPPYNIGKEYEDIAPMEQYVDWCATWIDKIYKCSAADGAFWLNLGYAEFPGKGLAVPLPYLLWDITPFYLLQELVWNYAAGVACKRRLSPRNEKFLWYVKDRENYKFNLDLIRDPNVKYPNQKKNGKLKCNPLGKNPSDVWQIAKVTSGKNRASIERTDHPAQFPIELIRRLFLASSNEYDIVLDPFSGSGTCCEVGLITNRHVIGFEVYEPYLELSAKRLENASYRIKMEASQPELAFSV